MDAEQDDERAGQQDCGFQEEPVEKVVAGEDGGVDPLALTEEEWDCHQGGDSGVQESRADGGDGAVVVRADGPAGEEPAGGDGQGDQEEVVREDGAAEPEREADQSIRGEALEEQPESPQSEADAHGT